MPTPRSPVSTRLRSGRPLGHPLQHDVEGARAARRGRPARAVAARRRARRGSGSGPRLRTVSGSLAAVRRFPSRGVDSSRPGRGLPQAPCATGGPGRRRSWLGRARRRTPGRGRLRSMSISSGTSSTASRKDPAQTLSRHSESTTSAGLVVPGDPQRAVAAAGVEEDRPRLRAADARWPWTHHAAPRPRAPELRPTPAVAATTYTGPRARAARGGSAGPGPEGPARRTARSRKVARRRVQRAEDLRPAAVRARGHAGRRRHPARQVPRHRAPAGCTWCSTSPAPAGSAGATRCPTLPAQARATSPRSPCASSSTTAVRARHHRGRHHEEPGDVRRPRPRTTSPGIASLGPDPLADDVHHRRARARSSQREGRKQIKGVLRHQGTIAGIGNAYSDELLHAARMSPFKPANSLDDDRAADPVRRDPHRRSATRSSAPGGSPPASSRARRSPTSPCTAAPASRARSAATPCARCRFADSSLQYCPTCQTGGKPLADRRMSRLLK